MRAPEVPRPALAPPFLNAFVLPVTCYPDACRTRTETRLYGDARDRRLRRHAMNAESRGKASVAVDGRDPQFSARDRVR